MEITEGAKQTLSKLVGEKGAEGIRVHAVGSGCCGPQIGLSLDQPKESDVIEEVNGIRVAVDQQVKEVVDKVTLDKDGEQFVLKGLDNCC